MQRRIEISIGESYHIYNRGVEKRKIFLGTRDRERFLRLLFLSNGDKPFKFERLAGTLLKDIDRGKPLVGIGAYVLMPNHFHLLLKEITEGGISSFMEKLTTAYSSYFNKVNERVGSLFQGTYRAEHAESDEYLKYLLSYIHLNPVKLIERNWREKGIIDVPKVKKFLKQYRYSSCSDYVGVHREESLILNREVFPEYFSSSQEFNDFLHEWLTYRNEYSLHV